MDRYFYMKIEIEIYGYYLWIDIYLILIIRLSQP